MKLVVFGGSGHVGQAVVQAALARDHQVTVFVHRHSPFRESQLLKIVRGDVHQASDVLRAVHGAEAVVSTLGSLRGPAKDVLSSAVQRLVPAMDSSGVQRIVTLTGYSAFASFDAPSLLDRAQHRLFDVIAPKVLRDAEDHIRLLQDSDLAWSVLRAPVILKSGRTGYRLATAPSAKPWQTIPRAAVAAALLDLAESNAHLHEAPFIFRT